MVKVRAWVQSQIKAGRYHGQLVANFDQVWSVLYRPKKRNLQQRSHIDEHARSMTMRKIRHCVERILDVPYTEMLDPSEKVNQVHSSSIQGGEAATAAVDMWRVPRTVTTISWADGSLSRPFITCRSDYLTESQRQQANQARSRLDTFYVKVPMLGGGPWSRLYRNYMCV